jgi:hypothetical protein
MIGVRKLGIVISAAAIGGAALTGALWAGTAHAQSTASISVTSAALGTSLNNQLGSEQAVLTFSVTCPAGDTGYIDATASQGGTGTGHSGSDFACTGSAQSVSVTTSSTIYYAVGQVYVGASLDIGPTSSSSGPYGMAAGTASIVPVQ